MPCSRPTIFRSEPPGTVLDVARPQPQAPKVGAHALEVDPGVSAVRRHDRSIHLHLLLAVPVARLPVPLVLVFTLFTGFGIQLEGYVFDREGGTTVCLRRMDLLEGALQATPC